MRIAVYHNLHSGGAKRVLFEQVRRLSRHHDLTLFSLASADEGFCDLRSYVRHSRVYGFRPGPLFRSPFGRLNQGVRLVDLMRLRSLAQRIGTDIDASGYDVVLVHPCQYTQSPLVLGSLSTPTVYYCHEPLRRLYEPPPARRHGRRRLDAVDPMFGAYRLALRRADRGSLRSATRVLVNSHFTQKNVYRIYGIEACVCPPGVDVDLFRPLGLSRDTAILSVGALTPNKGLDLVIEGLAQLSAGQRPSLIIVSNYAEPQERAYLEDLAATQGVKMALCTAVSDEKLVEAYNRASLVAYAPVREPLGLVPLEAAACETAVIGVRDGGVVETVRNGETGLLVERNPEAFGRALQTLLDDRALTHRLGRQGRRFVETEWAWKEAIVALEQCLGQTMALG